MNDKMSAKLGEEIRRQFNAGRAQTAEPEQRDTPGEAVNAFMRIASKRNEVGERQPKSRDE